MNLSTTVFKLRTTAIFMQLNASFFHKIIINNQGALQCGVYVRTFTARYLMVLIIVTTARRTMDKKKFAQINFDFNDTPVTEPAPSVGIRVKSLKTIEPDSVSTAEAIETEEPVAVKVEEAPLPKETVKKSTRGRKSLKALDAEADLVNIPANDILFQRQYYAIGEVAGMFGVNQSLLRFWENEFDIIQPRKNRKGDRHFRPVDIRNLELIYDLLRRRKLTIEGAKDFLKKNKQARERFEIIQSLQKVKDFLLEIKASL